MRSLQSIFLQNASLQFCLYKVSIIPSLILCTYLNINAFAFHSFWNHKFIENTHNLASWFLVQRSIYVEWKIVECKKWQTVVHKIEPLTQHQHRCQWQIHKIWNQESLLQIPALPFTLHEIWESCLTSHLSNNNKIN